MFFEESKLNHSNPIESNEEASDLSEQMREDKWGSGIPFSDK